MPLSGEPVPVPTDPTMAALGIREEALRAIDPVVRARHWEAAFDEFFASINARRIVRPILSLPDVGALSLIVRLGDMMALGYSRGFKPSAGQDEWITKELARIDAKFEKLESGTWRPMFTDSTPSSAPEPMGPLGGTDALSDTWATQGGCGGYDPCGGCK